MHLHIYAHKQEANMVAIRPVPCNMFCLLVLLFQTKITRPFLHHMFTKALTSVSAGWYMNQQ